MKMNTTVEPVDIIKLNVDNSTLSFRRNGLTATVKYLYYGTRSDLTSSSAYNAYVIFNNNTPLIALITIKNDLAKMIEQRNNNFFCGIVS